jgi:DNA-binding MarR family transcriptional regulator
MHVRNPTAASLAADRPAFLPSGEAVAALRAHPRFGEAMRTAAGGLADLYEGSRLLNLLANDRGRFLIGYLALYLHFTGDPSKPHEGLTSTRLQALCAEQGVCSPGRVAAVLALMRATGYLESRRGAADRRIHRLVPTPRLIEAARQRWKVQFSAMAPLLPDAEAAPEALHRVEFVAAFLGVFGIHFGNGLRVLAHAPELAPFTERNAGLVILFSLLCAAVPGGGQATRPVQISVSGLSRRFGVSRIHVLELLRDAERDGFIERRGAAGEQILVLARFVGAMERLFATVFLVLAHCAREALTSTKSQTGL